MGDTDRPPGALLRRGDRLRTRIGDAGLLRMATGLSSVHRWRTLPWVVSPCRGSAPSGLAGSPPLRGDTEDRGLLVCLPVRGGDTDDLGLRVVGGLPDRGGLCFCSRRTPAMRGEAVLFRPAVAVGGVALAAAGGEAWEAEARLA